MNWPKYADYADYADYANYADYADYDPFLNMKNYSPSYAYDRVCFILAPSNAQVPNECLNPLKFLAW